MNLASFHHLTMLYGSSSLCRLFV